MTQGFDLLVILSFLLPGFMLRPCAGTRTSGPDNASSPQGEEAPSTGAFGSAAQQPVPDIRGQKQAQEAAELEDSESSLPPEEQVSSLAISNMSDVSLRALLAFLPGVLASRTALKHDSMCRLR